MSLSWRGTGQGRRNTPLLLLLLALPLSLLVHCSSASNSGGNAGGSSATTCSPPATGCAQSGSTGQSGSAGQSGGGPPTQACSSLADCDLPRSICDSSQSLVFYTNASCNNGQCTWQQQAMVCPGGCFNGGCSLSTTTASGPPLNMSGTAGMAAAAGVMAGGAGGSSGETSGGAGAGG